jgi:hypothetical protein
MRIVGLVLLFLAPLQALAAGPYARSALEDQGPFVADQQIYVTVDVFAPNFFTSPPQFPLFELPNALVTLPEERPQNLDETVDGVQYSGIRRRYVVVPQIPGEYHVPVIEIELGYSVDGAIVHGAAETAPLSFSVGGDGATPAAFVASNVALSQAFDRPPNALRVGDAVVRTITVTAEDAQAIMIPPSNPGTAAGLAQHTKAAKTEDGIAVDRRTVSRRTETLVYTALAEGTFIIPAIEYPWFDLERHEAAVARLPATEVAVAPTSATVGIAPEAEPQRPVPPFEQRRRVMLWIFTLLAAVAIAWIFWRLARAAYRHVATLRERVIFSRSNRLRLLRNSIRHDDPAEVYSALQSWSRFEGYRTLDRWMTSACPDLAEDVRGLELLLYSGRGGSFDRQRMARLVTRDGAKPLRRLPRQILPDLNPTH